MIPANITRKHVLRAIQDIEREGTPEGRKHRKFALLLEGKEHPPKYVLSLANVYANGNELRPEDFSGGIESNSFLRRLGFEIIRIATSEPVIRKPRMEKPKTKAPRKEHTERCPECKKSVEELLRKVYGEVIREYSLKARATLEDYEDTDYFSSLKVIYEKLQDFRGHHNFVRTKSLYPADYFVPRPGFILEFDESQHFTAPRKIALENYPEELILGYDKNRWKILSEQIDEKDNDPACVYRDEQRAWYDTLKDFLPAMMGLSPTVRLYSKDTHWCSLNPDVRSDVKRFKALLEGRIPEFHVEIKVDPTPSLARIIIAGDWQGDVHTAKILLNEVCDNWPEGKKVDCLITCGAFLKFRWPESLTDVGDNKFPSESALNSLIAESERRCDLLMDEDLRKRLSACTDYMTIGIDTENEKISLANVSIRNPHAELVALFNLREKQYRWTGKSFPTSGQENGLIRFPDLSTHFVDLPFGKVMVLGCHDLNAFSRRGKGTAKSEWRIKARDEFYKAVRKERPEIVLHHPHTTDSSRIWTASWNELEKTARSIEKYAGSGRYYRSEGPQRSPLDVVLKKTKLGNTVDFVVTPREGDIRDS